MHKYSDTRRVYTAKVNSKALDMAIKMHVRRGKPPSYQELADMCKVSKSTISNLMGKRTTFNPETAAKIEEGLGVDANSIFTLAAIDVESTGHRRAA